jgi:hypothetical protein
MTRIRSTAASHPVIFAAAGLAFGLAVFVLLYFEPQKLFIDDKVNEALPSAPASAQTGDAGAAPARAQPKELASGDFRGLEHGASGHALVIEVEGERYLRFEDFETSNGPDLRVYLSAAPSQSDGGAFDDDFMELGHLKGNIGNQNYVVPASADLSRFRTAVVWCKRFGVGFAAAPVETKA